MILKNQVMLGDKEAVNKDMYSKLVKKVNVIQAVDANNLVKKTMRL